MICKLVIFFAFGALGHAVSLSRSVSTALFAESLSFSMASSENKRPSSFAALSLFYEIGCIAFKEQLRATLHFFFLANLHTHSQLDAFLHSLRLPCYWATLFVPLAKIAEVVRSHSRVLRESQQRLSFTYSSIMIWPSVFQREKNIQVYDRRRPNSHPSWSWRQKEHQKLERSLFCKFMPHSCLIFAQCGSTVIFNVTSTDITPCRF